MSAIVRLHDPVKDTPGFYGLIGTHPLMLQLFEEIAALAAMPIPVLVQGSTGTGKELVVQALHELSGRRGRVVSVNLAALPESLAESELFGSVRGAFTGATDRPGLIEEADGGTLYLDEAGDATQLIQAKLLRVIESGVLRRIGCRRERRVSVRIVASVQQPESELLARGAWRSDFYYRLAGGMLHIPDLCDRMGDVPDLINHFLVLLRKPVIDARDLQVMKRHTWPGNVRELKRVVERAVCAVGGGAITSEHLINQLTGMSLPPPDNISALRGRAQRQNQLVEVMARFRGDTARVAQFLGLSRSGLYYRLRQLGIPTPQRSHIPPIPVSIQGD